jgi:hypothetical protein
MSCGFRSGAAAAVPAKFSDRREHLPPMPEQDADLLKVLVSQVAEDRDVDPILGKTLGVLGHTELFEPIRNLLLSAHEEAEARKTQ